MDCSFLEWCSNHHLHLSEFRTLEHQGCDGKYEPCLEDASFAIWFWSGGRSLSLVKDGGGDGDWKENSLTIASVPGGNLERSSLEA